MFSLYSTDHVQHVPGPLYILTDKIEFFENQDSEDPSKPVDGHIDLRMNNVCNLNKFIPPRYYSPGFHHLEGDMNNGPSNVDVPVHFIDDNHLILKISRNMVFQHDKKNMPHDAPAIFTYYGIRSSYGWEQKEKQKEELKKVRGRSETPEPHARRDSFNSVCSRDMKYYMRMGQR